MFRYETKSQQESRRHFIRAAILTQTEVDLNGLARSQDDLSIVAEALGSSRIIQKLYLNSNQLGDEGAQAIARALGSNKSLRMINLCMNGIGDSGALALFEACQMDTCSLRSLHLHGNKHLTDEGIIALSRYLLGNKNSSLREIHLGGNQILAAGGKALASSCSLSSTMTNNACHLQKLSLSFIPTEGALAFCQEINSGRAHCSLQKLDLRLCGIGVEGLTALLDSMETGHARFQELELDGNHLGDQGACILADFFRSHNDDNSNNNNLLYLSLGDNEIGEPGANGFFLALQHNIRLQELDLSYNFIGNTGAKKFAECLPLCGLRKINLSFCGIRKEGASAIASALQRSSTLEAIDLSLNSCGQIGLHDLFDGLKSSPMKTLTLKSLGNKGDLRPRYFKQSVCNVVVATLGNHVTLTELDLSGNCGGVILAEALRDVLQSNTQIQAMDLSENTLGDEGTRYLAEGLQTNRSLRSLRLARNEIGSEGAKYIAVALGRNRTLQSLCLRNNRLGKDGANAFLEALKTNFTLRGLNIFRNDVDVTTSIALASTVQRNLQKHELLHAAHAFVEAFDAVDGSIVQALNEVVEFTNQNELARCMHGVDTSLDAIFVIVKGALAPLVASWPVDHWTSLS